MAEEAASGGSVLKKWGPLAAIVLIAQVVVAFVLIQRFFPGGPSAQPKEDLIPPETQVSQGGEAHEGGPLPHYYSSKEFEKMTANPAGTNGKRFVMFSVQLGLQAYEEGKNVTEEKLGKEAEKALAKLHQYDNKIKAVIVGIVREKTIDELEGDALQQVQEEIMQRVNDEVMKRAYAVTEDNSVEITVSEVVFSDIIIQ